MVQVLLFVIALPTLWWLLTFAIGFVKGLKQPD